LRGHALLCNRTCANTCGMADGGGSRFAGAVLLGDLDDFVAPSQACVNPLFADGVNGASTVDSRTMDVDVGEVVYVLAGKNGGAQGVYG